MTLTIELRPETERRFLPDPFVIEHGFSLSLAPVAQRHEQNQQSRLRLLWLQ